MSFAGATYTAEKKALLAKLFPQGGAGYCHEQSALLREHPKSSLQAMASKLGIKADPDKIRERRRQKNKETAARKKQARLSGGNIAKIASSAWGYAV